jgi:hypothetical protein
MEEIQGVDRLTNFQVHLAKIFFSLKPSEGYVVAGGPALLASELIDRPTQDIDLFASAPVTAVQPAKAALLRALARRGYDARVVHDSATFCRLVVDGGEEQVLVDLAIDSPPTVPPIFTILGPTLVPVELAGRKLLALFGRAEARDFADVYGLARRFGKDALIAQAGAIDAGFDLVVLAQMLDTMSRFTDDEIPLETMAVPAARDFFNAWTAELGREAE